MNDRERLLKQLEEIREEMLAGIQESVQIDSTAGEPAADAPYGPGPKKALDWTLALGERLGLRTGNVDNKAGYVEIGEGDEMVAVLGHLDVVPAGEGWDYPAFGGEIHDGVMYGRGVLDDKGPTIGAIFVLKAIKDAGIPLKRRIRVIFGTDEERGSGCMQHYVASSEEKPVMGFTPDAEYPVIFFEKGMSPVKIGVKQPKQGDIKVLELDGGNAGNIVPKNCKIVLEGEHEIKEFSDVQSVIEDGKTVVTAVGKNAHGSTPELGVNAITKLLTALADLPAGGDFAKIRDFVRDELRDETNGESLGIRYVDEETGETTVNLGLLKMNQDELSIYLDIRYPKNADPATVKRVLEEKAAKYGLEILGLEQVPMLHVPKDSQLVQLLMQVYREETGDESEAIAIGGGTYAKTLPNIVAFGPIFPGEPDVIHQPNERWEVDKMLKAIRITALGMLAMANAD